VKIDFGGPPGPGGQAHGNADLHSPNPMQQQQDPDLDALGTKLSKVCKIGPKKLRVPVGPRRVPVTLGDEVEDLLEEWYASKGIPIPPEDIGIGAKIDAAEAAYRAEEERWYRVSLGEEPAVPLAEGEEESLEAKAARLKTLVGPKPDFGSDEFWAWARRKRTAENAERAAQGLPPLPTAKEKAAAKALRAEEKAAKAAAKKK
jgi:hypothetical protein